MAMKVGERMKAGFERLVLALRWATLLFAWVLSGSVASAQALPARGWPSTTPAAVGLDGAALVAFDADLANGKYGLADSLLVIRCGKEAIEKTYPRNYEKIYGVRAKQTGPLNHDLNGPYNYFSAEFHPYYRHSDMHTMQSVSKTVTSGAGSGDPVVTVLVPWMETVLVNESPPTVGVPSV